MTNNLRLSRQDAAKELLRRKRARRSIAEYAQAITIPGKPISDDPDEWLFHPIETSVSAHHVLLLNAADDLIHGELKDERGREADGVIAMAPPGSAKSTYLDVVVPTYCMGKFPGYQVILTGYGSDILKKHGRRARQICASPEYKGIWGTSLRPDNRAADEWSLDNGSEYMAGGITSGLTGNRGNLLIGDDLIKGRNEAESQVTRDSTWNGLEDDAFTRLKPKGKTFLIGTRWHEDDPIGRILPENWSGESGFTEGRDGRLWYVICLQAECERADDPLGRAIGEHIWPEWFSPEHFAPFRTNTRSWRSLFQQTPTADEGTYFKREWFSHYEVAPDRNALNVYISIDSAETQEDGDYTFMLIWGVAPDGKIYLLNGWRGQVETDVWVKKLIEFIRFYKPSFLIPEDDNIFKAVKPFLQKEMRKANAFTAIESMPHGSKAKTVRAQSFQGIAGIGLVHLPANNSLAEVLRDQLLKFPAGTYDDGVDACSAFGRFINRVWEKDPPKPEPEPMVIGDTALVLESFAPPMNGRKQKEW